MRNRFDRELTTLNTELIEMGALIENAIDRAVGALFKQDEALAERAIEFAASAAAGGQRSSHGFLRA